MALSFTLVDRGQPRWLQFVIQCVLVSVVGDVVALCLMLLGSVMVRLSPTMENALAGASAAGVGFFLGLVLARIVPSLRSSGRWIWIPPLALFAIGFVSDLWVLPKYYPGSYLRVIAMSFSGGDEGLGVFFDTYPVYTTVAYSLAMFVAGRKRPQTASDSVPRVA